MSVMRLGECLARVGESPVWDAHNGAIYWVDIVGQRIFRTRLDGDTEMIELDEPVGSIACTTSGGLIAALRSGVFKLSFDDPRLVPIGAPSGHPPSQRFNDSTTDAQGNLIVGTLSLDPPGEASGRLYQLRPNGEWRLLLEGFRTVNGLAVAANGTTLYVSDSHPQERSVWRCEYDAEAGTIRGRELFVRFGADLGRPDGAAMDADDHYWVVGNDGWAVHRFAPSGTLVQSVPMPVQKPSKLAFGDSDLRTMYITSIAVGIGDPKLQPHAGALFKARPAVTGLALAPYPASF